MLLLITCYYYYYYKASGGNSAVATCLPCNPWLWVRVRALADMFSLRKVDSVFHPFGVDKMRTSSAGTFNSHDLHKLWWRQEGHPALNVKRSNKSPRSHVRQRLYPTTHSTPSLILCYTDIVSIDAVVSLCGKKQT